MSPILVEGMQAHRPVFQGAAITLADRPEPGRPDIVPFSAYLCQRHLLPFLCESFKAIAEKGQVIIGM